MEKYRLLAVAICAFFAARATAGQEISLQSSDQTLIDRPSGVELGKFDGNDAQDLQFGARSFSNLSNAVRDIQMLRKPDSVAIEPSSGVDDLSKQLRSLSTDIDCTKVVTLLNALSRDFDALAEVTDPADGGAGGSGGDINTPPDCILISPDAC